jgi:ketosteroid isomerase-like protein
LFDLFIAVVRFNSPALAVRAFALSGNLAEDVKAFDEFNLLRMKVAEAFTNNDAAALAALFTQDALLVEPEGVFNGREAIDKALADLFQRWRPTNFLSEANKLNSIANGAWAVGQWWCTLESPRGPVPMMGYWSEVYVREGEAWQIRVSTLVSKTPLPLPTAGTK